MDPFYTIVIIVATVVLILLLTVVGIILSQKNNALVYPSSKNTCPDYWTAKTIPGGTSGNTIVCTINDINKGSITGRVGSYNLTSDKTVSTTDTSKIFTPGYSGSYIDFNDNKWATEYSTTQQCALNKWANKNKINWDGISNFNGC
jgi:Tfp pilus assembly protein PilW